MFTKMTRSDFFSVLRSIGLGDGSIENEMARFRINVPPDAIQDHPSGDPIYSALSGIRRLHSRRRPTGSLNVRDVLDLQIALERAFEHYDRHASSQQEQHVA